MFFIPPYLPTERDIQARIDEEKQLFDAWRSVNPQHAGITIHQWRLLRSRDMLPGVNYDKQRADAAIKEAHAARVAAELATDEARRAIRHAAFVGAMSDQIEPTPEIPDGRIALHRHKGVLKTKGKWGPGNRPSITRLIWCAVCNKQPDEYSEQGLHNAMAGSGYILVLARCHGEDGSVQCSFDDAESAENSGKRIMMFEREPEKMIPSPEYQKPNELPVLPISKRSRD